ncbi:hypothetical protein G6F62_015920 [Rhizopus arrhizus]|nr:hypothetical protein G6F62_015920 [Rhizopus arrhizus]
MRGSSWRSPALVRVARHGIDDVQVGDEALEQHGQRQRGQSGKHAGRGEKSQVGAEPRHQRRQAQQRGRQGLRGRAAGEIGSAPV